MQAPVPFIVGVQYKTDEVRSLCGGLVRVNMYKDQVFNSPPLLKMPTHTCPAVSPPRCRFTF